MKERRPDFRDLLPPSGSSLIFCIELLIPLRELRRTGETFSEFLLPDASCLTFSLPPSEFLLNGCFVDPESRGCFTASTSSESELRALSFCLAATFSHLSKFKYQANVLQHQDRNQNSTIISNQRLWQSIWANHCIFRPFSVLAYLHLHPTTRPISIKLFKPIVYGTLLVISNSPNVLENSP